MSDSQPAPDNGSPESPRQLSSLDWDEVKELGAWWFHPLVERETWAAAGYLAVGLFASIAWFVATVVLLSVSLSLLVIGVGLVLCFLAFGVIDAMAGVERARAEWIDVVIQPRPVRQASTAVDWLWVRLVDAARWRQVAYFLLGIIMWPVVFGAAYGLFYLGFQAVFSIFEVNIFTFVLQAALAVGMLGFAPRATVWIAQRTAEVVDFFLGVDKAEQLQARVETVETQRDEILDAVASERRRIERNLHDGVQQQLVALGIDLGMAAQKMEDDPEAAKQLVDDARDKTRASIGELPGDRPGPAPGHPRGPGPRRRPVRGGVQRQGAHHRRRAARVAPAHRYPGDGLLRGLRSREQHHEAQRRPAASIKIYDRSGVLHMSVHDDGKGGANLTAGSGLAGMAARVRGVDGRFDLYSPDGGPTTLTIELPHE